MSVQSLYQNISLIDASTHGKKRIKPLESLSVVSDAHGMFVAGTEFQEAAKEFPIIFVVAVAPTEAKPAVVSPVAVLGLQRGDNLFVDAQGKWTGNYVPAFLRRLPFIVADIGEGRLGVCVDENSTQLSETEGEAMFDDKGEPTQLLKDAVSFVQTYHDESERTRMFCELLVKHDLLTSMNATFDLPNGEKLTVDGLLMVEDAKLQGLKDEAALELFRSGAMSWIVAHQLSMSNFQRISALHNARHMAKAA